MNIKINKENIDIMTAFFRQLQYYGEKDKNVYFISADHGAWALADFKKNLKNQYMNIGISEQNMVSLAAGMALNGKKVFIFTITPFAMQRCFEQIKMDICFSNLPVTIVGNGSSLTYAYHGTSHQAIEDLAMMRSLPNLKILNPSDNLSSRESVKIAYNSEQPVYIKLDKGFYPDLYSKSTKFSDGILNLYKQKNDLCIFSTGCMLHNVKKISSNLKKFNIKSNIFDIYIIKPINKIKLKKIILKHKFIISIEEQHINGGIGSLISEVIADENINIPILRFGIKDKYSEYYGDRNWLQEFYEIDIKSVTKKIMKWIKGNGFRYKK